MSTNWIVVLSSSVTVVSFVVFIGIMLWAVSSRRHTAFAAAANAPFALPDEHQVSAHTQAEAMERQS